MLKKFSLNLIFRDKINAAELFRAKSPSLARCKEGDLPLLNFSNLTCMHFQIKQILLVIFSLDRKTMLGFFVTKSKENTGALILILPSFYILDDTVRVSLLYNPMILE